MMMKKSQKKNKLNEDDSSSDPDGIKYDAKNEKYYDLLYDDYLKAAAKYRYEISLRNKERKMRVLEELPEDLTDFSKYSLNNDELDENIEGEPNELVVEPLESKSQKVEMWFDHDFEDIGEDDDDVADMKKIDQKIQQIQRKRKAEDDGNPIKKRKLVGPQPKPTADVKSSDNSDDNTSDDINERDSMDELTDPKIDDENMKDEDPIEDYDNEDLAELLAMGEISLKPAGMNFLQEKGINKLAFDDEGLDLPRWFTDEENNHNKPQVPVTKDQVREWKEQLKAINSRSTKKVVEAKARKKRQLLAKKQKANAKAKAIAANNDIGEREKIKQIQKLYKGQLSNVKPNKVYVVGRKFTGSTIPKGNVRIKLVDPRMKKDKRGLKAADNRKRKRN